MGKTAYICAGGAAKGSFQAGVLKQIVESRKHVGLEPIPDIFFGTSSGALNATALVYGGPEAMENLWFSIKGISTFMKFNWKFLFFKGEGIFNPDPLRKLVSAAIAGQKTAKSIKVARVRISDGMVNYVSNHDPHYIDALIGSAAMPGIMTPVDGFYDGGMSDPVPLRDAIGIEGVDEIHILMADKAKLEKVDSKKMRWYEMMVRAGFNVNYEVLMNDIKIAVLKNQLPQYKKVRIKATFIPENLDIGPADFSPNKIQHAFQSGYQLDLDKNTIVYA